MSYGNYDKSDQNCFPVQVKESLQAVNVESFEMNLSANKSICRELANTVFNDTHMEELVLY